MTHSFVFEMLNIRAGTSVNATTTISVCTQIHTSVYSESQKRR